MRNGPRTIPYANGCHHVADDHCVLADAVDTGEHARLHDLLLRHDYTSQHHDCLGYALHAAALEGSQDSAELLLADGADINFFCGPFGTALQAAIAGNNHRMVEWLLQRGATPGTESMMLCTPLQSAACWRQHEIVSVLLNYGADPNQVAGEYHTALQIASAEGHVAIIKTLLQHGANVNAQGGKHGNALQAALSCGRISLAHAINLATTELESTDPEDPYHAREHTRYMEAVVLLLRAASRAK